MDFIFCFVFPYRRNGNGAETRANQHIGGVFFKRRHRRRHSAGCLFNCLLFSSSVSFFRSLSLSLSLSTVHQLFPALQFTTYLMTVTDTVAVAGEPPAEPSPNPMAFNPTNPMNEPGRQGSARVSNVNTNRDNPPPPPFFIVDSRGLRPTRFFSIGADKGDRSMVPLALARTRVAQIWKSWPT